MGIFAEKHRRDKNYDQVMAYKTQIDFLIKHLLVGVAEYKYGMNTKTFNLVYASLLNDVVFEAKLSNRLEVRKDIIVPLIL